MVLKNKNFFGRLLFFIFLALHMPGTHSSAQKQIEVFSGENLGPYISTPIETVKAMLRFASVTSDDIVCDIGCGDGRIVVTAAKVYGARGIGIDIDPLALADARRNVEWQGVGNLVSIRQEDATAADLSEATVVTIYLLPEGLEKLKPNLERRLKPGTRVIFHNFPMKGWKIDKIQYVTDYSGQGRVLYLSTFRH